MQCNTVTTGALAPPPCPPPQGGRVGEPKDRVTLQPDRPDDAPLAMLRMFARKGALAVRRWHLMRFTLTPEEALNKLKQGESIEVQTRLGVRQDVADLTELVALDTLEGAVLAPCLDPFTASAMRLIGGRSNNGEGLYRNGWIWDRKLTPYQAWKALQQGEKLEARYGCNAPPVEVKTLEDVGTALKNGMARFPLPVAEKYTCAEPIHFITGTALHADTFEVTDHLAFLHPWPRGSFAHYLTYPSVRGQLAASPNGAVGFFVINLKRPDLHLQPGEANLDVLAVTPAAQGQKVGERLLLEAIQVARKSGSRDCYLQVDVTNTRARKLYEKIGFQAIKTLPNFYDKVGHDGVHMRLADIQSDAMAARLAEFQQKCG